LVETLRPEPSRSYRWIVLVVVSMTMFGNYYVYDCIAPIADLLAKQLGFSDSNIGLLQAIYSIPNVFMVLVGGYIVDRIGTRKGILLFGTICLLGAGVTVLEGKLAVMATGRLIFGLGAESLIVAVTTAIAAAVEEQGAATREIARNIQHAAGGTSQVSSNIVGVSTASADAGVAANEVLKASAALRREADGLRSEIDAFLNNIRAA